MHGNSNRIEIEGASMRQLIKYGGVALAGLATSILTAVAVAVFDRITGFNLFTFAVWAIVPAGAGLCGFAAASGYYFAAKFLHQRPTLRNVISASAADAADVKRHVKAEPVDVIVVEPHQDIVAQELPHF